MTESTRTRRCAIYTRKSSEEGLDQSFNSLDAQRAGGEAFILSQQGEGWTCLADRYDDGAYSGGNMERPALKRLLADIAAGKIDIVVVYKTDRLTRSIRDFSKIMEIFDAHEVSLVAVTQSFNTSTSMGRLGRESVELDDLALRIEALERAKDLAPTRLSFHGGRGAAHGA